MRAGAGQGPPPAPAPRSRAAVAGRRWSQAAQQVARVSLAAACFALPAQGLRWRGWLDFSLNDDVDRAAGVLVADVALAVAAVAGALVLIGARDRAPIRHLDPVLLAGLGLFLAGGLAGLVAADDVGASAALLARLVAVVLGCAVAVWGAAPSGRWSAVLFGCFVLGATESAVLGTIAVETEGWAEGHLDGAFGRAVGFGGNSGSFAVLTALALAMVLVVLLESRRPLVVVVLGVAAAGLTVGLFESGTRGVLPGVLVVLGGLVWRTFRTGRWRVGATALAVVAVVVLGALLLGSPTGDRLLQRSDRAASRSAGESSSLRWDQVAESVDARGAESLLIGSGLVDLEPTAASIRDDDLRDPHSGHLEVWLGTGLLGLAGWLVVVWATAAPGLRRLADHEALVGDDLAVLVLGAAWVSYVVSALTANNVWNRYIWLLVAGVALLSARGRAEAAGA